MLIEGLVLLTITCILWALTLAHPGEAPIDVRKFNTRIERINAASNRRS